MAGLIRALGRVPILRELDTDAECVCVYVPEGDGTQTSLIVHWDDDVVGRGDGAGWSYRRSMSADTVEDIVELRKLLNLPAEQLEMLT